MTELTASPIIPGLDRPISRLALGTAFFRAGDQEACHALLDAFVAAGGTLIDSGRMYGDSEQVIGAWLDARGTRERVTLLTKCAHGTGQIPAEGYPQLVQDELATSLRLLGTDSVDLYLLHRDNHQMTVQEILEPLNAAIERGQVRRLGASNWEYRRVTEANAFAAAHGLHGFSLVSNTISLATPAAAFYPGLVHVDAMGARWHRETGIPLLPWSSQARGFFAGACPRPTGTGARRPPNGYDQRMQQVYGTPANFARLDRARTLGERKGGLSATQIALAWVLHRPYPVVPVVGPRTPEELASCVRAGAVQLTPAELHWLETGDEGQA